MTVWAQAPAEMLDGIVIAPYHSAMSVEVLYLLRKDESGFRDLDAVVLLEPVVSDEGDTIPSGSAETVVGVWADGEDCIVEFAEPDGALANVPTSILTHAAPTGS